MREGTHAHERETERSRICLYFNNDVQKPKCVCPMGGSSTVFLATWAAGTRMGIIAR